MELLYNPELAGKPFGVSFIKWDESNLLPQCRLGVESWRPPPMKPGSMEYVLVCQVTIFSFWLPSSLKVYKALSQRSYAPTSFSSRTTFQDTPRCQRRWWISLGDTIPICVLLGLTKHISSKWLGFYPITSTWQRRNSITEYSVTHGLTAEVCVQEMRKAVHAETQLTVSAGIAPNKVRATPLRKASNN